MYDIKSFSFAKIKVNDLVLGIFELFSMLKYNQEKKRPRQKNAAAIDKHMKLLKCLQ